MHQAQALLKLIISYAVLRQTVTSAADVANGESHLKSRARQTYCMSAACTSVSDERETYSSTVDFIFFHRSWHTAVFY